MSQIVTFITIIGVLFNTVSYFIDKKKTYHTIHNLEYELYKNKIKIDELEKKIDDNSNIIEYFESQLTKLKLEKESNLDNKNLTDLIEYNYDFL